MVFGDFNSEWSVLLAWRCLHARPRFHSFSPQPSEVPIARNFCILQESESAMTLPETPFSQAATPFRQYVSVSVETPPPSSLHPASDSRSNPRQGLHPPASSRKRFSCARRAN